uniref:Uncharacterized protein n=1 Tax=Rhizophora mucronata TaxID=61149 RepID=A0A2P2QEP4_RHIMU
MYPIVSTSLLNCTHLQSFSNEAGMVLVVFLSSSIMASLPLLLSCALHVNSDGFYSLPGYGRQ